MPEETPKPSHQGNHRNGGRHRRKKKALGQPKTSASSSRRKFLSLLIPSLGKTKDSKPSPEQDPGHHGKGLRPNSSGRHPSPQQAAANCAVQIKTGKREGSEILKGRRGGKGKKVIISPKANVKNNKQIISVEAAEPSSPPSRRKFLKFTAAAAAILPTLWRKAVATQYSPSASGWGSATWDWASVGSNNWASGSQGGVGYGDGPTWAAKKNRWPMQLQLKSNWCWAAVTLSIKIYYDPSYPKNSSNLTNQCKLVNAILPAHDSVVTAQVFIYAYEHNGTIPHCCWGGFSQICDRGWNVIAPMNALGINYTVLQHLPLVSSYPTIDDIADRVYDGVTNANRVYNGNTRPIITRIAWVLAPTNIHYDNNHSKNNALAHFVAIWGCWKSSNEIYTLDPYWGPSVIELSNFPSHYFDSSDAPEFIRWTHSYYTSPNSSISP